MSNKWKRDRIRWGVLETVWQAVGTQEFTNAEVYKWYRRRHLRPNKERRVKSDFYWMEMNVRNTLCAATKFGLLERLGAGRYIFTDAWREAREERI